MGPGREGREGGVSVSEDRVGYPVDEGDDETRRCAECGAPLPDDLERCLGVTLRGGYGMFFDDLVSGWTPMTAIDAMTVWLCHDCAVFLLCEFPGLSELLGSGEHPSNTTTLCCAWGHHYHHERDLHERLMDEATTYKTSGVGQWLDSEGGGQQTNPCLEIDVSRFEMPGRAAKRDCTCDPSMRYVCDVCSGRPSKGYGKPSGDYGKP